MLGLPECQRMVTKSCNEHRLVCKTLSLHTVRLARWTHARSSFCLQLADDGEMCIQVLVSIKHLDVFI